MAAATTTVLHDGRILHSLKETPAWVVIGIFVVVFLIVWNISHDDFIPRIIDGLMGALLTSIIGQRSKGSTNIKTEGDVNTESMSDATINTDSVNLNKEEK